jgi:hypothetical protein
MRKSGSKWAVAAAAAGGALAAYVLLVRPWHLSWGATEEEALALLPGDEFVHGDAESATHAVTIDAPVEDVWPWLVQVGQDKGGFYSYSWLENLFGCRMRNVERVVPEFQHLRVGDGVRLHPKVPPLPVLVCEPYEAIVMGSNTDEPGTWGLYLFKVDERTTRLVARGRGRVGHGPLGWLIHHALFEPAHFVMERKMLLEIKRLAEATERAVDGEQSRRGLNMEWSSPRVSEEEQDGGSRLSEYRTDANRFELRCGMCGGIHYADAQTFERVNAATRAGLDNPFMCDACEEEYDELAYDG